MTLLAAATPFRHGHACNGCLRGRHKLDRIGATHRPDGWRELFRCARCHRRTDAA